MVKPYAEPLFDAPQNVALELIVGVLRQRPPPLRQVVSGE